MIFPQRIYSHTQTHTLTYYLPPTLYLSFFQYWKRSLHNVMAFLKLILFYLSLHYRNSYKIMLFFSVCITRIIIVPQPLYFNAAVCLQNPSVLHLRGHLKGKLVLPLLDASIPSTQPQFGDMDNFHTFRDRGARQAADPLFRQNWFWEMSYVKKSNPMNLPFIHWLWTLELDKVNKIQLLNGLQIHTTKTMFPVPFLSLEILWKQASSFFW